MGISLAPESLRSKCLPKGEAYASTSGEISVFAPCPSSPQTDFAIQVPARELRQNSELEPFGLVVTEWWWWYGATPGGLRAREYGLPAGGRSRGLPILLLPDPPIRVLEPEVADELPEAAPFFLHPPAACHQLLIASSRAPSIVTAKSALISHLNALLTHIGMSLILSSSRGCEV